MRQSFGLLLGATVLLAQVQLQEIYLISRSFRVSRLQVGWVSKVGTKLNIDFVKMGFSPADPALRSKGTVVLRNLT